MKGDEPAALKADLILAARAKINLHLEALGQREDGYTEIVTIFQTVSIADNLFVKRIPSGISIDCRDPLLPVGQENLAYQAAALFFAESGLDGGVELFIEKKIPLSAGLGGGSSDAAAVLKGLNLLYDFPLEGKRLYGMAAELGSDVPFFLLGGAAIGRGRGEMLEPLPDLPPLPLIVVHPGFGVSTAEAYALLDRNLTGKRTDISIIVKSLSGEGLLSASRFLKNDLQEAVSARYPEIRRVLEAMEESGASFSRMSGSGSSCYGIFATESGAEGAADLLARREGWKVMTGRLSPRVF